MRFPYIVGDVPWQANIIAMVLLLWTIIIVLHYLDKGFDYWINHDSFGGGGGLYRPPNGTPDEFYEEKEVYV